ncbi:hypothetical protein [uncultured Catenibacterium sp.]|uniref:hypothetical protein n=1 Tax=uncultured Catenibacterium sp. TaxID=286142 RepID=UPI0025D32F82|nr:hypothetical protein [uncultured Catenibacterium sp.]
MKLLYRLCLLIAVILSHIMCGVVAYNYCDMEWKIKVGGNSAPASLAYLYAIPFVIGIVLCVISALYFKKKLR